MRTPADSSNEHPRRGRLLSVGDNVVDRYPQHGMFYPGGNAVNVAVHARRLGVESAYLGALGTDFAGRTVRAALELEGVDTAMARIIDGPNAFAVVELIDGNRQFHHGDLGVSLFSLTADDLAACASYDIVHTGECSGLEDQLADLAKAARRLSFDFSERPWDYIERYAPLVDIAVRSEPTADVAAATTTAERLRALGPSVVAVTLGSRGAIVATDEVVHQPAPDGPIVDTLGAGDAFIARLLVALIHHEPTATIAATATGYATQTCASFGAFGHPTPASADSPSLQPARHLDR